MIEPDAWRRLPWEERVLSGADHLALVGPGLALYIEAGSLALFASEIRDGKPAGPRRYLARLEAGQAAFSTPGPRGEGLELLLVPVERASVRSVPLAALWADARANGTPAAGLVDGWIRLLSGLVHPGAAGTTLEQDAGSLSPEQDPPLQVTAPGGPVENVSELEAGLSRLHDLVLDRLRQIDAGERSQELARLRERERVERARLEGAVAELEALFEPGPPPFSGEDPLLAALQAVGHASGITIRPPPASEALAQGDPLEAIARSSRVRLRRVVLDHRWWRSDCGDLLSWSRDESRRPLALLRTRGLRYQIFDPADGTRVRVNARTARALASEAVMLYRPLPERRLGLLDLLRFPLERRRRDLAFAAATALAATVVGMVVPQATALLIDRAVPDADQRSCLEIGLCLLAAALGQTLFRLAESLVLLRTGAAAEVEAQTALWDRLLRLRAAFFRRFSSGDLESRMAAIEEIGRELGGVTLSTVFTGLLALLNLALLYLYIPHLMPFAVGIGALVLVFTLAIGSSIRSRLRQLAELRGRFFGLVVQLVHGVGKLRVAGAAERAFAHWLGQLTQQLKVALAVERRSQWPTVFHQALPALCTALFFGLGHGQLVESRGAATGGGPGLGEFLAFLTAFGVYLGGISALSSTFLDLLDVSARVRRVEPILKEPPESDEGKCHPGALRGSLALESVDFRYSESGPLVLEGVSLRVEPGQFVAIVGPSGSGKSTLLRLLLGFEVPTAGVVRYDGRDLAELDVTAVRRQLGVVLQGGRLDAGSVLENIACGTPITLDEAWAAAEDSGIAQEIREMPMGMHTVLSTGGSNLSTGQRQRLLIARALVQRPRMVLLDEATSALDNRTQAVIARSLERLQGTRLVVAHRLSTVRNADRLFVLDAGRLVQQGSFEELAGRSDGLFARLMKRQIA